MKVIVIHQWDDSQKDTVSKFFDQLVSMAKSKQLPKGMKLERVDISYDSKTAVCQWDVENMDMLVKAAQQFNISWKITPMVPKTLYEHKLF